MPDEATGETPKIQTVTETVTPASATGETPDELRARLDEMAKALKEANREAASRRKRLDELEAAEKARADAALTETQKLEKSLQEAQTRAEAAEVRAREIALQAEVRAYAATAGFIDPTEALKLADLSKVEIDPQTGTVKGAKEAIDALAKAKPHLLRKTGPAGFGATNPGNGAAEGETDAQRMRRLFG